jgi:acetyl/propionyl-CoA carboxylase alpha subunit
VTEYVTGLDLVREQFQIAEGKKLPFSQKDIQFRGHSIEVRIQAEDVWNDFLPSLGTVSYVRHPGGAFIRNDSALFPGLEVSGFYDSLLSKLIVWDSDRDKAILRMKRALEEMRIVGVSTSIPFAHFVMENKTFRSGKFSTRFVEDEFSNETRDALYQKLLAMKLPSFATVASELKKDRERKLFIAG